MQKQDKVKVAIFASGMGSNAESLIRYSLSEESKFMVSIIITNREKAGIYDIAAHYDIPIAYLSETMNASIIREMLQKHGVQVIALAGYMRLLPSEIVKQFEGRIINVHPSLLPEYGGHGMYGKKVHMAVFNDKKPYTGITIHHVDEQYDTGSALCQTRIPISDCLSIEEVAEKVKKVEHLVYPLMLNQLCKTIYTQE
jgi:phosphoribosylglycinamide formyltransferase-1